MTIPLDKNDVSEYTPPSLANVVPKPVFRFRPATVRDQKAYAYALQLEGLRLFPDDLMRAETRKVLKEQWSPEDYEASIVTLENIWEKIDQDIALTDDEQNAIAQLSMQVLGVSPMLRRMDADNRKFADEAPAVALGMYLAGWRNVDAPFRMNAGQLPYEVLIGLSKALTALEQRAVAEKVEDANPGMAWLQLSLHAFSLLNFDKAEEKNSDAPSPSLETPNGIPSDKTTDGASETMNSAPTKTRRTSSRPKSSS